jgi:5-methylcytosine-specific restriction endonuclease McrA
VRGKAGFCDKHRKRQHRAYNLTRDKNVQRLYSSRRWHTLRDSHLGAQPFCANCGAIAEVAHHSIEHGGDPFQFFDASVLVSLCNRCHEQQHRRGAVARRDAL